MRPDNLKKNELFHEKKKGIILSAKVRDNSSFKGSPIKKVWMGPIASQNSIQIEISVPLKIDNNGEREKKIYTLEKRILN